MVVANLLIRFEANLELLMVYVEPHIQEGYTNARVFPGYLHTRSLGQVFNIDVQRVKDENIINVSAVKTVKFTEIVFLIEGHIQICEHGATMDTHWYPVRLSKQSVAKLKNRVEPENFRGLDNPLLKCCIILISGIPVDHGRECNLEMHPRDRRVHCSNISSMKPCLDTSLVEGSHFFT